MVGEFGVAPSEYWRMSIGEVYLVLEHKKPKQVGNLSLDDIERLDERRAELEAQGITVV